MTLLDAVNELEARTKEEILQRMIEHKIEFQSGAGISVSLTRRCPLAQLLQAMTGRDGVRVGLWDVWDEDTPVTGQVPELCLMIRKGMADFRRSFDGADSVFAARAREVLHARPDNLTDDLDFVTFKMNTDFAKLRSEFSEAIAPLAQYRRSIAWDYVANLERHIVLLQRELATTEHQLSEMVKAS